MCVCVCVCVCEGAAPEAKRGGSREWRSKKRGRKKKRRRGRRGRRWRGGGGCLLKTAGARSSEKCQVKLFLTVLISAPHSHNYM